MGLEPLENPEHFLCQKEVTPGMFMSLRAQHGKDGLRNGLRVNLVQLPVNKGHEAMPGCEGHHDIPVDRARQEFGEPLCLCRTRANPRAAEEQCQFGRRGMLSRSVQV